MFELGDFQTLANLTLAEASLAASNPSRALRGTIQHLAQALHHQIVAFRTWISAIPRSPVGIPAPAEVAASRPGL